MGTNFWCNGYFKQQMFSAFLLAAACPIGSRDTKKKPWSGVSKGFRKVTLWWKSSDATRVQKAQDTMGKCACKSRFQNYPKCLPSVGFGRQYHSSDLCERLSAVVCSQHGMDPAFQNSQCLLRALETTCQVRYRASVMPLCKRGRWSTLPTACSYRHPGFKLVLYRRVRYWQVWKYSSHGQ
jgi:hypothetical protein